MTPRPNNASKLKLGKQTGFCVSVNDEQNRYRVPWHEPRGPRSELRLRAGGLPRSEPRSLAQCRTSAPSSAQLKRQLILTALICRRLHAFIFSFGVSCLLSFVRRRSQGCVLSALPRTEINCRDAGRVCVQPVPMSCGYEEAADSARRGAGGPQTKRTVTFASLRTLSVCELKCVAKWRWVAIAMSSLQSCRNRNSDINFLFTDILTSSFTYAYERPRENSVFC